MIINSVSGQSGLNVNELVNACLDDLNSVGTQLSAKITKLTEQGGTIDQGDMLAIQFEVGQYNAMLEMVSTVTKSLTDMMKTLAQRSS